MTSGARLIDTISRHAPTDGAHATPLPGVSLLRASAPTMPMPVVYEPTLCLIVQGRKKAMLGATTYVYDADTYLVASVHLPVTGTVIEASAERPYLCLRLDLDMAVLSELALRHAGEERDDAAPRRGLACAAVTPPLLDAATRLVALLDTPRDIAALAPLATQEILYRLLTAPDDGTVLRMARANSHLGGIARAIAWIRAHYTEACRIEELAETARMSRSTFHTYFKEVTTLSPLEFRTQLRLHEARRLMVAEGLDAGTAGFKVGYESPSQFSRDYARVFGAPPARDAGRLRGAGPVSAYSAAP